MQHGIYTCEIWKQPKNNAPGNINHNHFPILKSQSLFVSRLLSSAHMSSLPSSVRIVEVRLPEKGQKSQMLAISILVQACPGLVTRLLCL